ncbi:unnamed protein product, partial [Didymodactylos carnosus]
VTILDARPFFGFHTQSDDKEFKHFFIIYVCLAIVNSIFTLIRAFTFAYGGIEAARKMHKMLLNSLLKCSISFFDVTPSGRILNRFSSDTWCVDDSLPFMLNILLANIFSLLGTLVLSSYGLPEFLFVLIPLAIFYYFIQNYYRWTSREIKRISSVALSPVYANFGETLAGLTTIRAFRHVKRFVEQNISLVRDSIRTQFASLVASSWLNFRLQLIGIVMVVGVSLIGVFQHIYSHSNPSLVGLSLSYILSVTGLLNGLVTSFTETEKEMVSVERVTQYIDDLPEEETKEQTKQLQIASDEWLNVTNNEEERGLSIDYIDVSMKYNQDQARPALDTLSFHIRANEKIGIVGRTAQGLDYMVVERGRNLSVGQKQLFCLARALLSKSKVLCLDEATANVDMETDSLIQKSIHDTCKNVTVLTIAHRIQTIMDSDRVLVMDQGKIKEFDSPKILNSDLNSYFHKLVKQSQLALTTNQQ